MKKNVKYDKNAAPRTQYHHVKGSMLDVVRQIRELSNRFKIYDFMIHTDQEDISQLLKLVKDFDSIVLPMSNLEKVKSVELSELTKKNFDSYWK